MTYMTQNDDVNTAQHTNDSSIDDTHYQRRFKGTKTLYEAGFKRFEKAHVIVIGVGGVGSWAVEGLARTGVGILTLVDLDVLVASNVNRQLPALDSTFGKSKIEVMAERAKQINPFVTLNLVDDFLTASNVDTILPNRQQIQSKKTGGENTVVLDCTDDMAAKIAIALHCRFNKLKLICAGGAGGKTDPQQVTVSDLKDTYQDPLLARLRTKLRHEHNINTKLKEKFGIRCVYSTQPPKVSKPSAAIKHNQTTGHDDAESHITSSCVITAPPSDDALPAGLQGGLHCGGYGSAVVVTSVVGMVMVSEALLLLSES